MAVKFSQNFSEAQEHTRKKDHAASAIIGRKVDLNTPACLSNYFRDQVLSEARDVYGDTH